MKKSADMNKESNKTMSYLDQVKELSYYKAKLIAFLADAHPRYITRNNLTAAQWEEFLTVRANDADTEAEKCIHNGMPQYIADEYAKEVLFRGLQFSEHQIIGEILESTYPHIKETLTPLTVEALEDYCLPVFEKYGLGDDYATDPLYETLLRELQDPVHQFLMDNV